MPGIAEPMRIVCLGDSITLGTPYVEADETYESFLQKQLSDNGLGARVISSGIGGETTSGGLTRFEVDVISHFPACVTIMYGANDCLVELGETSPRVALEDFKKNLLRMIEWAVSEKIEPILMTAIPFGNKCEWGAWPYYRDRGTNCLLPHYVDCVREIAAKEDLYLIDNHRTWVNSSIDVDEFTVDGVHPKVDGHKLIANTMLPVIKAFAEERNWTK
ncbi:MAG: GDSL-type esterase/lipase family protein [Armatimonadota bacterium]